MNANRTDQFNTLSVPRAVLRQITPAVASQLVTIIYNLADTYFVGLLNQPVQTAAITVATPVFIFMTAISNLFGIGGASALSRALGRREQDTARQICGVSFWCGLLTAVCFCLGFGLAMEPVLRLCGADADTMPMALGYARWTVVIGGTGTIMSALLANLIRSEGRSGAAGAGLMLGGLLNVILDPFFVLPQFLNLGAVGAAMATALSNRLACVFFLCYLYRIRHSSVLSLQPGLLRYTRCHIGAILAIGLPAALQFALTVVSAAAQTRFMSQYGTEAIAAFGIVKRIDQLPLFTCVGVANGLLPMLAYYAASGNLTRRRQSFRLGCAITVGFSTACLIVYEIFAPQIAGLFMDDTLTVLYSAAFLRRMVVAMPLMAVCYPMIIQFQTMGRARESLIMSILRKGVLDIPLLFLLDYLWGMYGLCWVQPLVDSIALVAALLLYRNLNRTKRT